MALFSFIELHGKKDTLITVGIIALAAVGAFLAYRYHQGQTAANGLAQQADQAQQALNAQGEYALLSSLASGGSFVGAPMGVSNVVASTPSIDIAPWLSQGHVPTTPQTPYPGAGNLGPGFQGNLTLNLGQDTSFASGRPS